MALTIERIHGLQGQLLAGFFVRNGVNKIVAIGAFCGDDSFVMPSHKCYARDVDLCRSISNLTGVPIKWNLTFWCRHITSHNRQDLMRRIKRGQSRPIPWAKAEGMRELVA